MVGNFWHPRGDLPVLVVVWGPLGGGFCTMQWLQKVKVLGAIQALESQSPRAHQTSQTPGQAGGIALLLSLLSLPLKETGGSLH